MANNIKHLEKKAPTDTTLECYDELNESQRTMVEAFVNNGLQNKSEAYREGFGDKNNINQCAFREFNKPKVKRALAEYRKIRVSGAVASKEEVAHKLTKIALGNDPNTTNGERINAMTVLIRMMGYDEGGLQDKTQNNIAVINIPAWGAGQGNVDEVNELGEEDES